MANIMKFACPTSSFPFVIAQLWILKKIYQKLFNLAQKRKKTILYQKLVLRFYKIQKSLILQFFYLYRAFEQDQEAHGEELDFLYGWL